MSPHFSPRSGHRFPPHKLQYVRHSNAQRPVHDFGREEAGAANGNQICGRLSVPPPIHTHFSAPRPPFSALEVALDSGDQCASSCASDVARGARSGQCQLALRHASVDHPDCLSRISLALDSSLKIIRLLPWRYQPQGRAGRAACSPTCSQPSSATATAWTYRKERFLLASKPAIETEERKQQGVGVGSCPFDACQGMCMHACMHV